MSKKNPLKTPAIVSLADFSVFKCCDIQGSHLIGYLWVSLIIGQSECLVFYFFCTELALFCIELPENCIYLNQSDVSILLVKKKGTRKTIHLIYRHFLNRNWDGSQTFAALLLRWVIYPILLHPFWNHWLSLWYNWL